MKKLNVALFGILLFLSVGFISSDSAPEITLNAPGNNNVSLASYILFNCTGLDDVNLTNVTLYLNNVANETNVSGFNDTAYLFNKSFSDGSYNWTCGVCDNAIQCANAIVRNFVVSSSGPTYSSNSTNSTSAGKAIVHRLFLQDNNNLSGYIFSFDNCTGTFANSSWQGLSGRSNWSNVTKLANYTSNCTIQWKIYSNDSTNQWSNSSTYSYNTSAAVVPTVSLISPISKGNFSSTNVSFNCSAEASSNFSNMTLYGNWSGWHANQTIGLTGLENYTTFSKIISTTGYYAWNCYACDNSSSCDFASSNKTFWVDTVNPLVKLANPSNGTETVTNAQVFKFNVTDNFGIKNCSLYLNDAINQTKYLVGNSTLVLFDSINISNSSTFYRWNVKCFDFAGNSNQSESWFIKIVGNATEPVLGNVSEWANTYTTSTEEEYTKELGNKDRIKILIDEENHYVGVVAINSSSVTINVSSITQQAKLTVGEEKKFEVTGDKSYDLLVKLNSILNNKANITIKQINEKMSSEGGSSVGEKIFLIFVVGLMIVICGIAFYFFRMERNKLGS